MSAIMLLRDPNLLLDLTAYETFAAILAICLLAGSYGTFFRYTRLEFCPEGIMLWSPMAIRGRFGKRRLISYNECHILEGYLARVGLRPPMFCLFVFAGKKRVAPIRNDQWPDSYKDIRQEFSKRLQVNQCRFGINSPWSHW